MLSSCGLTLGVGALRAAAVGLAPWLLTTLSVVALLPGCLAGIYWLYAVNRPRLEALSQTLGLSIPAPRGETPFDTAARVCLEQRRQNALAQAGAAALMLAGACLMAAGVGLALPALLAAGITTSFVGSCISMVLLCKIKLPVQVQATLPPSYADLKALEAPEIRRAVYAALRT